jgi:hypothetical protein
MANKPKKAKQSKNRSPNYPYIGLASAIGRTRTLYDKDYRNRMSKEVVAQHLGYGGLNGVSLSVISALGKFGLLESVDDDLQVSADAVSILVDPDDSPVRQEALRRAALKPALFAELFKRFGGQVPSEENLLAHLQKNSFTPNAAAIAVRSFRETMQLVSQQGGAYDAGEKVPEGSSMDLGPHDRPPVVDKSKSPTASSNSSEREFLRSPLSSQTRVRILVEGPAGPKEIDKLIRLLTVHKELMQEDDGPENA